MKTQLIAFLLAFTISQSSRVDSGDLEDATSTIVLEMESSEDQAIKLLDQIAGDLHRENHQAISDLNKQISECSQQVQLYESQLLNLDSFITSLQSKISSLQSSQENSLEKVDDDIKTITVQIALLKQSHIDDTAYYQKRIENHKASLKNIEDSLAYITDLSGPGSEKASNIQDLESLIINLNHLKNSLEEAVEEEYRSQEELNSQDLVKQMENSLNDMTYNKVNLEDQKKELNQELEESLAALRRTQEQKAALSKALLNEKVLCGGFKEQLSSLLKEAQSEKDTIEKVYSAAKEEAFAI
ncbi:unnamed protein product [Blepharisma stoltei]|uniref:Uncharacterized protein n=1 Tax=Blepharisma stoltei TaxID=1481888 RepID=A0AAU9IGA2_9CILI|nr:unnamed protein product [Blepharisma stoltei]